MSLAPQQYVCDLSPYQPGLPIELVARKYGLDSKRVIKLASNENPLGMSPKARAAIEHSLSEGHRYPERYNLVRLLADYHHISPEMIILGNGSNDVLDLIARTFLSIGDESVSSQYAFAIYSIAAQSAGARNVIVPARNFSHDLPAMLSATTDKTKMIWLANPNNPTGTFVSYKEIKEFIQKVPKHIAVVLDEAYYEYLDQRDRANTVDWVRRHPNLIIVRTFSKIYGLAGLRIGYGIVPSELAQIVNRIRQPFNVNTLALSAAASALNDTKFLQKSLDVNAAGKNQLTSGLRGLNLECLPAYGNFVTFKVGNATKISESLLRLGIVVRPLGAYGMPDWIRVSVGTPGQNQKFLDTLANLL